MVYINNKYLNLFLINGFVYRLKINMCNLAARFGANSGVHFCPEEECKCVSQVDASMLRPDPMGNWLLLTPSLFLHRPNHNLYFYSIFACR